jgi:hypothetical protein
MMASIVSHNSAVRDFLAGVFRPAVRCLREVPVHSDWMLQRGRGPLAVFLPAYGPEGAALLRIYSVAAALRPMGWRTLVLPSQLTLAQRHRVLAQVAPDVLVMQGARHALNRPRLYPGQKIVFDMDDADFHLPHLASPVERAMVDVTAVVAGSAYVADWCRAAGAREAHVVWTGSPMSDRHRPSQIERPPVIAWAQSRPMTYVREADRVREVIAGIAARQPGVTLRLFDRRPGDDPGFAASFQVPGLTVEWAPKCQYSDYLAGFDDVALGLAPLSMESPFSRGKSFGKVLAYLDARVPVIASAAGEHGAFFTPQTGVVSNDTALWIDAACRLLNDGASREQQAAAAFDAYRQQLSTEAATKRLAHILSSVAEIEHQLT